MDHQTWTVKNLKGKKLGSIKKLIIDSTTRQIAYADVTVGDGPHTIRIPWRLLVINKHGILLKATHQELAEALSRSTTIHGAVTLEVAIASEGTPHQKGEGSRGFSSADSFASGASPRKGVSSFN